MLDIRWLEDFLAIATTRNFTKAADLRNVSQSGLSRRVQSLEHWARAPLIDRNAVPLELTEAGRDLQPVAAAVIASLAQVQHRIADRANLEKKIVRLTAPHLLSTTFFPEWLPRISQVGGNSDIVVISQNLLGCCEALDRADVHFVVCLVDEERQTFKRLPEPLRPDEDMVAKVGEDRLIPVSAPNADGSARFSLDGADVPFLQYTPECSLAWSVEELLLTKPELKLRKVSTNPFADGLRLMVTGGVGVAWLPETLIISELQTGAMVHAGDPTLDIPLDIVVVRPSHRLGGPAEHIWQSIVDLGVGGDVIGRPCLRAVS